MAPKRLAFLTYLVLARPRGLQRRDRMAALFWPELDQQRARGALRQTLRQLRRALGPDVIVVRGTEEIGIAEGSVWCDAIALEDAAAAGRFESAIGLFQGDLLDAVFASDVSPEFEQWLDGERNRVRRLAAESASGLATRSEAAGDLTIAQAWARRAVELAPLDESAVRQLALLLDRAGERAEALAVFEALARRLEAELGAVPSPETAALLARIRHRETPRSDVLLGTMGAPPSAAPPAPVRQTPRSRTRAVAPFAIVLAAGLALVSVWVVGKRAPTGNAGDRIAVLPFTYRGTEELAYLGEGIVPLLSGSLDGAAELRAVDARALLDFTAQPGRAAADAETSLRIAKHFGAALYVTGEIVEAGGELKVSASLHEVSGTRVLALVGEATQQAGIFQAIDDVARGIVASRFGAANRRIARRAATTTESMAALRAYLDGERAFRRGAFHQAVDAFELAVGEDSAFALAHYRLSEALDWAGTDPVVIRAAAARAWRHAHRLTRRDQALLAASLAWRRGAAATAETQYRNVVSRYPDDVEGWFQLGEVLFHQNPLRGRPIADARPAFERVLALDPDHGAARLHLARLAATEGRLAELRRLARAGSPTAGDEVDLLGLQIGLLEALTDGDTNAIDRALTALEASGGRFISLIGHNAALAPDPLSGERLARRAAATHRSAAIRASAHLALAYLAVARGRWSDAQREFSVAESLDPHALAHRALVASHSLLPIPTSELASIRAALTEWRPRGGPLAAAWLVGETEAAPYLRVYLLGLVNARLGDLDEAAVHLRALEASAASSSHFGRDLALGLRATIASREGRIEDALRALESLSLRADYGGMVGSPFMARSYERYLRAELLRTSGRGADALPWYQSVVELSPHGALYRGPSLLRRAEIHEALGDVERARDHYTRFVELWRDCGPEFRPMLDAARRRLVRLNSPLTTR